MDEVEKFPDTHHDSYSKTLFGFWLFIITDFILFGTLFATYSVLRNNTFGGPSGKDLYQLEYTFLQSIVLLVTSFIVGIAGAFAHRRNKKATITLLCVTFVLGCLFFGMMIGELSSLIAANHRWVVSAYLSMFYTIVATHGLHVLFALLWTLILLYPLARYGIDTINLRRVSCLRMFWQFINVIWVFVFTLVYLLGGV